MFSCCSEHCDDTVACSFSEFTQVSSVFLDKAEKFRTPAKCLPIMIHLVIGTSSHTTFLPSDPVELDQFAPDSKTELIELVKTVA